MLADGVDIAVVSRMLGHRNVSITAQLYQHPMPYRNLDAVECWDLPENDLG
jgi:site-specific recombinase XerD